MSNVMSDLCLLPVCNVNCFRTGLGKIRESVIFHFIRCKSFFLRPYLRLRMRQK